MFIYNSDSKKVKESKFKEIGILTKDSEKLFLELRELFKGYFKNDISSFNIKNLMKEDFHVLITNQYRKYFQAEFYAGGFIIYSDTFSNPSGLKLEKVKEILNEIIKTGKNKEILDLLIFDNSRDLSKKELSRLQKYVRAEVFLKYFKGDMINKDLSMISIVMTIRHSVGVSLHIDFVKKLNIDNLLKREGYIYLSYRNNVLRREIKLILSKMERLNMLISDFFNEKEVLEDLKNEAIKVIENEYKSFSLKYPNLDKDQVFFNENKVIEKIDMIKKIK
jgi:hypothetical protein